MLSRRHICTSLFAVLMLPSRSITSLAAELGPITPKAGALAQFYDATDVSHLWLAGQQVHWETGLPTGKPVDMSTKHTHCSAFAASVAKRLGIYILRPPEHSAKLLANAQLDWLQSAGAAEGWRTLFDAVAAQAQANRGDFVVAVYRNHHDDKPGHIAIIRPSLRPPESIATDGPDVIQAGLHNYTDTTLAIGFAGHPRAWKTAKEVKFYAHDWDGKIRFSGAMTF